MKMSYKHRLTTLFAAGLLLSACAKWTEPQSVDFGDGIKTVSEEYLAALRAFKATEHKVTIVTMDGQSVRPSSRSHHLIDMPDSADYICMRNVAGLFPSIAEEIPQVREKKGTKVICDVDYQSLSSAWQDMEDAREGEDTRTEAQIEAEFRAYVSEGADRQLACCDEFGFDGIMVSYSGTKIGLGRAGQEAFMARVEAWKTSHQDGVLIFSGDAMNLVNTQFLASCDYIVVPMGTTYSANAFTTTVDKFVNNFRYDAVLPEIRDKFLVEVNVPSEAYPQQEGYDPQPIVAAGWVVEAYDESKSQYTRNGICVDNVQEDYLVSGTFAIVRRAISLMNPLPDPEEESAE